MVSGEDLCTAARLYGLCTDETFNFRWTYKLWTYKLSVDLGTFLGYINIRKRTLFWIYKHWIVKFYCELLNYS